MMLTPVILLSSVNLRTNLKLWVSFALIIFYLFLFLIPQKQPTEKCIITHESLMYLDIVEALCMWIMFVDIGMAPKQFSQSKCRFVRKSNEKNKFLNVY